MAILLLNLTYLSLPLYFLLHFTRKILIFIHLRRKLISLELGTTFIYLHPSLIKELLNIYYGLGIIEIVYIMTSVIKEFTLSLREEYRCPNVFLKHKMCGFFLNNSTKQQYQGQQMDPLLL